MQLGVEHDAPLHLTWSCYRGGDRAVRRLRCVPAAGPRLRGGRAWTTRPWRDRARRRRVPTGGARVRADDILVSEVFSAIQGEAALVGERQVFVRLTGCNIRCAYCDQPEALERAGRTVPDRVDGRTAATGRSRRVRSASIGSSRRWRAVGPGPPPLGQPHGGRTLLQGARVERAVGASSPNGAGR